MTGALPPSVAPKVARLVRLLGSPMDGEALAAARALDRTLRGAGRDLHDLAAIVERPEPPRVIIVAREPETWCELARWCRDHDAGRLQARERKFVGDMAADLVCGGEPTERQAEWLRAIHARLRKGACE